MDNISRILLYFILIEKFYKHSSTYIIYASGNSCVFVFDIFCSEDHVYRKIAFLLLTCFSATLPTPTQQDMLYYNNSFQRTIKLNRLRGPNLTSINPASCLVTSFEPCPARNFLFSINQTFKTTMQIVRILIRVLSVCTIAKKRTPEFALP